MSRSTDDVIKVAVGIIINAQHHVLVALRPAHNPHGGLWEFPGGKFEVNETPQQALARELSEEIGVIATCMSPLIKVQHDYGVIKVELDTWRVDKFLGKPFGREGQSIRWVDCDELLRLAFPEGNRKIVSAVAETLRTATASHIEKVMARCQDNLY